MSGLFDRAKEIVGAKTSHILDAAEDPNETLDYSYEQMLDQLQNFKRSVVDVVTAKKQLELEAQSLEAQVAKLDGQAREAVTANREDLAKEALTRKAAVQAQLTDIDTHVKELEAQQEHLTDQEQQLETKIESFRTEKEVLKAQYTGAEAQVSIGEAATGIKKGFDNAGAAVERARDKTEQMTARAAAMNELVDNGTLTDQLSTGDDITRQLDQISQSGEVDAELAKMKAELGQGADKPALSEGAAAPAATEAAPAAEAPSPSQ